jgi:hypothetical protein
MHKIAEKVTALSGKLIVTSQYTISSRFKQYGDIFNEYDAIEMLPIDIQELISLSGLQDSSLVRFWSDYIYAFTSGHPQLVSAFVMYGEQSKWNPKEADFVTQPTSVDQVKAESRRLLANAIRNPEARKLARYLSLVSGRFDRDFAVSLGSAIPGLQEPGIAFDALIGPWIEQHAPDVYSLSPLLRGYAHAEVSASEIPNHYLSICAVFLKRSSLTANDIVQAMFAALTAEFDPLIAKLCKIQYSASSEIFKLIAKEIFIISHLYLDNPSAFPNIHPMTRFAFRHFQLKIAEAIEDWKKYQKIDSIIKQEISSIGKNCLEYKMSLWIWYLDTIIRVNSSIPVSERIIRANTLLEMVYSSEMKDIVELINYEEAMVDSLLMIATQNLDSVNDLEFLLNDLRKRSREIVNAIFRGFDNYQDFLSLLIDRVWLNESKREAPDWDGCLRVFSGFLKFSHVIGNDWLLSSAARGMMIVHDEYLGNPQKAFEILGEARRLLAKSHPLIDVQESMLFYRAGNHEKVVEIIANLESNFETDELPIHRVYALARGIRSAGHLARADQIQNFCDKGRQISQIIQMDHLRAVGETAFQAEAAWNLWQKMDFIHTLEAFENVIENLTATSHQDHTLFKLLRLRVGSAIAWLSNSWINHGKIVRFKTSLPEPFSGMFANFEDLPENSILNPLPPYPLIWANLAKFAASFSTLSVIERLSQNACDEVNGKQFFMAKMISKHSFFLNAIVRGDFELALESGLEYSKLFAMIPNYRERLESKSSIFERIDINTFFSEGDSEFLKRWSESFIGLTIEPIVLAISSVGERVKINGHKLVPRLVASFGDSDKAVLSTTWLSVIVNALSGNPTEIQKIREVVNNTEGFDDYIRRLSVIAMGALRGAQVPECLSSQFSILRNMLLPGRESYWAVFFFNLVAERWKYFANYQRFLMGSPAFWAPRILEAIDSAPGNAASVAKILLLVAQACKIKWPASMFAELHDLSMTSE